MGLLGKVIAQNNRIYKDVRVGSENIQSAIENFHHENGLFYCIILHFEKNEQQGLLSIAEMTSFHGAVCYELAGGNGLVLLPGGLDMELFSHRLSRSTDSTVLFQFSAASPSLAFEALSSYFD